MVTTPVARLSLSREFVLACGGYVQAMRTVAALSRRLWAFVRSPGYQKRIKGRSTCDYRPMPRRELRALLVEECSSVEVADLLLKLLRTAGVLHQHQGRDVGVVLQIFNPVALARMVLGEIRSDSDLRYAIMRTIRSRYNIPLSVRTVHLLRHLGELVNGRLPHDRGDRYSFHIGLDIVEACAGSLCAEAQVSSEGFQAAQQQIGDFVDCFFETCRAVGFISVSYATNQLQVRTNDVDVEYLVSHLFGVPTDIPGFDQLFGGGGLVLPETVQVPAHDPLGLFAQPLPARVIVIGGSRGSGKSMLASQLAVEIGKRGGVAWVMPLEQSSAECLYTLESMCALQPDQLTIAANVGMASRALAGWNENKGCLLLLRPDNESNTDNEERRLREFLSTVGGTAKSLTRGHLRLLIVDPLNSRLPGARGAINGGVRDAMRKMIEKIKQSGTNVLLVAEDESATSVHNHGGQGGGTHDPACGETLADTIISLSVQKRHNYAQRYFEIKKSRMQREQRGQHPFSIRSGKGIHIYPSPASVHARTRYRRPAAPIDPVRYGIDSMDDILAAKSLFRGDIILFRGPGGSFKTPLGLPFLLANDDGSAGIGPDKISLLFAARDSAGTISHILKKPLQYTSPLPERRDLAINALDPDRCLRVITLPHGHVTPGAVLQVIENEIHRVHVEGKTVHRIMLDNVSLWETSSPQICEDATFAVTLVDLLRGQRVTCLLVCGNPSEGESHFHDSLTDMADCIVQFDRFEFRGMRRVTLRTLKTRGMQHRLESFELQMDNGHILVKPSSSLLRLQEHTGRVAPVPIRMFFHIESDLQKSYFRSIQQATKAVLSEKTHVDYQDRLFLSRTMGVGHLSAVDELHILQLDEYQLGESKPALHEFGGSLLPQELWHDCLPRFLGSHVRTAKHGVATVEAFRAVPFYANISLLAFDQQFFGNRPFNSWEDLAGICWDWEKGHPIASDEMACRTMGLSCDGKACTSEEHPALFFDFPRSSAENYNCLFFEIFLSLGKPPVPRGCSIRTWLSSDQAVQAGAIMRLLCSRGYRLGGGTTDYFCWAAADHDQEPRESMPRRRRPFTVSHNALVYRHWYTTLNQMLHEMKGNPDGAGSSVRLAVRPLPQDISMSGEWYLGVPAYSAAPDAGLELIKLITARDAELNRIRLGVGLPTRTAFYQRSSLDGHERLDVSPYFDMHARIVKRLLETAFSRSRFACYSQLSQILAYHIKKILEIPDPGECRDHEQYLKLLEPEVRRIFQEFEGQLDFVQGWPRCTRLPERQRSICTGCRHAIGTYAVPGAV